MVKIIKYISIKIQILFICIEEISYIIIYPILYTFLQGDYIENWKRNIINQIDKYEKKN